MALNIKDPETIRLAGEVADLAGETKTRAVRIALEERKRRLEKTRKPILQFLEEEIWPLLPSDELGKPRLTKEEREEILGIGPDGA